MNKIPFLDLTAPHVELEQELVDVCRQVIRTASFVGGPIVDEFEHEFAAFCGAQHCVGVGNGTDALRFAIIAAGVAPGDTVITVPNTFIATTEAISQAGGRPDFVDIDERTYTIDPAKLREYIERRCRRDSQTGRLINSRTGSPVTAIVPVHLYGQMADMDAIVEIAEQYHLTIIEDACQAHGAEYFSARRQRWLKAGTIGAAAAFSFYPGKNLGACGEGGAVTTNNELIARRCRMLREHGQSKKYFHEFEGYNGRLHSMQAGLLRVKLRHLDRWNAERRQAARVYDELFAATGRIEAPHVPSSSRPVYHLYVVRVAYREGVQQHLTARGIGTGIHYPVALHLSPAYASLDFKAGSFPVAERAAREVLSLPMFPGLSRPDQQSVVDEVLVATSPVESGAAR